MISPSSMMEICENRSIWSYNLSMRSCVISHNYIQRYFVKQDYKLRTIIVHFFPHLWLLMLDEGLKADIKEGVMILRKISYPQVTKFPKRNFYLPHTNIICRLYINYLSDTLKDYLIIMKKINFKVNISEIHFSFFLIYN